VLVCEFQDLKKSCGSRPVGVMRAQQRLHRRDTWPTHMPRVLIGSIAEIRVSISRPPVGESNGGTPSAHVSV